MFPFILQLIYPKQCCACKEALVFGEEFICLSCLIALPRYDFRQEKSNYLVEKFNDHLPIHSLFAFAWFVEGGSVQAIMHQIKYKHNIALAHEMGKKFAHSIAELCLEAKIDAIVPVPLHLKRKRERGYNQSEEIAKGMATYLNLPVWSNYLKRTKYGESLVNQNRESRFEQLNNSFEVAGTHFQSKHILLLDDTLTTGATCMAAGKKLLESGASKLSIACLAVVR